MDSILKIDVPIGTKIKKIYPQVKICIYENKGLDLLPFVKALEFVPDETDFILKIHTKKSLYDKEMGKKWFDDLIDHVLPNHESVNTLLHNLEHSDAGMIGGSNIGNLGKIFSSQEMYEKKIEKIYKFWNEKHSDYFWISGSIFWVRYDIIKKLKSQKFINFFEKYQPIGYYENNTLAHSLERYLGKMVYDAGKVIYEKPESRYSNNYITLIANHSLEKKKKIFLFFHICCMNNYAQVTQEILNSIVDSGLYDDCDRIYYSLLGEPTDSFLRTLQTYSKLECVYTSYDITEFEYPLLTYLQDFAQHNDAYLFYFHTKGVSQPYDLLKSKWRERLIDKNINEYKKCISFLNKGCNVSGCGWKEHPSDTSIQTPYYIFTHSHFSGNFFWANSNYIKKLPLLWEIEKNLRFKKLLSEHDREYYRLTCEMWIGMSSRIYVGVNTDLNVEYSRYLIN
jgi:hypothetical protein